VKKTFSLLAALALTFVGVATSAHAQSEIVKVHVPFDFAVRDSKLPAGDYTFSKVYTDLWAVRNDNTGQAITAVASLWGGNQEKDPAKLVFRHVGSNYFLSEVHWQGQTSAVPASKAERSIQRETVRNGFNPETVYVLASAR